MTAALADARRQDDAVVVVLAGDWQVESGAPRFTKLTESASSFGNNVSVIRFDAAQLGSWDSSLLIFVREAQEFCEARKIRFDPAGLPDRVTRLLDLARAVPDRVVDVEAPRLSPIARFGKLGV